MNTFISEVLLALILVILSDGVAAALAARTCWRLRNRARLARPLGLVMTTLAVVALSDIVNTAVNAPDIVATAYYIQATIGRALRSVATWYLALKLMNGYSDAHREETNANTTS